MPGPNGRGRRPPVSFPVVMGGGSAVSSRRPGGGQNSFSPATKAGGRVFEVLEKGSRQEQGGPGFLGPRTKVEEVATDRENAPERVRVRPLVATGHQERGMLSPAPSQPFCSHPRPCPEPDGEPQQAKPRRRVCPAPRAVVVPPVLLLAFALWFSLDHRRSRVDPPPLVL